MKKIFTLMTIVFMAMNASAQEVALFENGGTYNNGATLTTANAKVVLGNDRTSKPYDVKLSTCKAYCEPLFGQTVPVKNEETGEMEDKARVVYVVGGQNPKDGELDGDNSSGSGYKPEKGNVPQSGTYYMFTPAKDGHVCAFIILNSGKNFYVAKASDGSCLPVSELTIKADGDEATPVALSESFTVEEKCTGTVEFDVVANETYYIFCTGSKLSFGGYVFTPAGGDTPVGGLDIEPALPVTFDGWDDSFLIKKTDVKAGDKFVFHIEPVDVEGWQWGAQVLPKSNADWSDLGSAIVPDAQGIGTFEITEDYAAVINANGGLRVQGMGCCVTAVEYVEGSEPSDVTKVEFDLTQGWDFWNKDKESIEYNADGTLTFNSAAWGGLSKWIGGADWSEYSELVFEFAEPTTVAVQPFVQYEGGDKTQFYNPGVTVASIALDPELKNAVKQFALQAAEPAKIVVKSVYLVKASAPTGVEKLPLNVVENGAIYNLAGQKVDASYKGVIIKNGKKFINK